MSQLFPRGANTIARVFIALVVVGALGFLGFLYMLQSSPYVTEVGVAREQPVPFSHEHHVSGLGLDCRYCHTTVETSASAGIPAPGLCMNCHKKVWADAPMLKPIRDSFKNDTPLKWNRVHDLPDFVYFNHSVHIGRGVACVSCHGKVNEMPLMWKEKTLYMGWCLDCHRNPEPNLRPVSEVTNMNWKPDAEWKKVDKLSHAGIRKTQPGHINQLTNCAICHR